MKTKKELLIDILFDPTASITEKDDAATDLEDFPENEVIKALASVGKVKTEDDTVLNSCGESLGSIWVRLNSFDPVIYSSLTNTARLGAKYIIESRKSEWLRLYDL